jgi:hypothetical protein
VFVVDVDIVNVETVNLTITITDNVSSSGVVAVTYMSSTSYPHTIGNSATHLYDSGLRNIIRLSRSGRGRRR